jgi:hypothetical protein
VAGGPPLWRRRLLSRSEPVSDLATRHGVSRKFVYQQTHKARVALDDAFRSATPDDEGKFELGVLSLDPIYGRFPGHAAIDAGLSSGIASSDAGPLPSRLPRLISMQPPVVRWHAGYRLFPAVRLS